MVNPGNPIKIFLISVPTKGTRYIYFHFPFPFPSDFAYDSFTYDPVNTRLLVPKVEAEYQSNQKVQINSPAYAFDSNKDHERQGRIAMGI